MSEPRPSQRIADRFAELRAAGRSGLVTFVTAGDPDLDTSYEILRRLPQAGADLIELGMPFSDPMADGPSIQASSLRALKAGATLSKTIAMVRRFREEDDRIPIILMGYFNPIYRYGVDRFVAEAKEAGVDGLIVVDLPPEEDDELCRPALRADLSFIRLATPTTDDHRLPSVLRDVSGFLYYVSIAGITGAGSSSDTAINNAVERLRRHTDLPIAVGFGIKTPDQAAAVARVADAAVVGSALVNRVAESVAKGNGPEERSRAVESLLSLVSELSAGIRRAA